MKLSGFNGSRPTPRVELEFGVRWITSFLPDSGNFRCDIRCVFKRDKNRAVNKEKSFRRLISISLVAEKQIHFKRCTRTGFLQAATFDQQQGVRNCCCH
jgi:hypothetical protein